MELGGGDNRLSRELTSKISLSNRLGHHSASVELNKHSPKYKCTFRALEYYNELQRCSLDNNNYRFTFRRELQHVPVKISFLRLQPSFNWTMELKYLNNLAKIQEVRIDELESVLENASRSIHAIYESEIRRLYRDMSAIRSQLNELIAINLEKNKQIDALERRLDDFLKLIDMYEEFICDEDREDVENAMEFYRRAKSVLNRWLEISNKSNVMFFSRLMYFG